MVDDSHDRGARIPTLGAAPYAAPSPVEHGGRVELRLLSSETDDTCKVYGARWFTSDGRYEGKVFVSIGDQPEVTIDAPPAAPEWLLTFSSGLMRTTARSALREGVWPRRLTRWRSSPTTGAQ